MAFSKYELLTAQGSKPHQKQSPRIRLKSPSPALDETHQDFTPENFEESPELPGIPRSSNSFSNSHGIQPPEMSTIIAAFQDFKKGVSVEGEENISWNKKQATTQRLGTSFGIAGDANNLDSRDFEDEESKKLRIKC